VLRSACPKCTFSTAVGAADGVTTCPSCGSELRLSHAARSLESEPADERFIVDVREAFESSEYVLGERAFRWSSDPDNAAVSSEARTWAVALPAGSRLDDFEIIDEVGRGGMGIVYRARQVSLNREVALKVLPPALHRRSSSLRRFRTEAQAVARLRHPNVVPIYSQGEYEGHLYYAMELIDGVSLDVAIRSRPELLSSTFWRGRFAGSSPDGKEANTETIEPFHFEAGDDKTPPFQSVPSERTVEDYRHLARLVAGVAAGLAHVNDQGVIHRDIKPHNLLLGSDGRLHITDFGLAHLTDEPHMTMSGEIMGTAAYLSPEQVRGDIQSIDHRTDVYSLGATLYELLTQRRPFEGNARDQILSGICMLEPLRPRRLDKRIPRDLETICLRAMEKEPARRFSSAAAMAEDLHRFADNRPILSRRVGLFETTFKWTRRHRAVTMAMTAVAASLILAAWLIQTTRASRRTEAESLLRSAYDKLAYVDYRRPDLVVDAIERAEAFGADPLDLNLVRALADLGASDNLSAMEHLQAVLDDAPSDTLALYMLAWAQWRAGDRRASDETFENAEALGGPTAPDAWFFRGLAAHFARPRVALESYRQANALRARDHEFYPQAVLHLARAHNQQMYVTRTTDTFAEAEASLRQLIDHKHYGAYPYYLMSIAHRLAAESHDAGVGGQSNDLASYHFDEALRWAGAGQVEDPTDDRPVTAEAECLESLGRFEEAIAARTRAIGLAEKTIEQWEGYHYRWRLYYWTDRFPEALADLEACEVFSPQSKFYAFVYPALVHAEMGEMEQAFELARDVSRDRPEDARALIWSATTLRILGRAEEAAALLSTRAASVDYATTLAPPQSREWLQSLYAYCLGEAEFADLEVLSDEVTTPMKLLGEAHFHAGANALAAGQRDEAFGHFTGAYRSFDGELEYTFHAKTILERMRNDPDWPLWLPLSPGDDQGGGD